LDPLAEVWIFIDAARSVHAALPQPQREYDPQDMWRPRFKFELAPSTMEYSASIAASLARYYLGNGRSVGLVSAGQTLRVLPSDRGGRQLSKILEALALVRPEGAIPLSGLIEAQARHLPRGSTVVVVTPSAADEVISTTDILLRRGLRPVGVLLNAATFGGYFSSEKLASSLCTMGIPVCEIAKGDDISHALSEACSTYVF
jgi:uncharacterized protein (DUF58 family)